MKRMFAISLCLVMLLLVGCSGDKNETTEKKKEVSTREDKVTEAKITEEKTTEVTTEEEKVEFVKDILLSNKFYMPGVQDYFVTEYTFNEDGTVESVTYAKYELSNRSEPSVSNYSIDEEKLTVSITDGSGYTRVYEYAESLGGFISDYDNEGDPMAPPSYYEFALIPLSYFPTSDELSEVYKNYMEYYEGPIEEATTEATTEASVESSAEYPYVRYSTESLSWNNLGEKSFVCEGTELSLLIMVTDGQGGTVYSYNSLSNPEAHVVYAMRPTDVSNNVITGGLTIIDANADMIYLGLYQEGGKNCIDYYDTETKEHRIFVESN